MQEYKPALLLYNINEERLILINPFIIENDIEIKHIKTFDYLKPLGFLLNIEGISNNSDIYLDKNFDDEMLVMFNFEEELMNNFLKYFKDNNIPSINLKAVLTPTNASWSSLELYKELKQEHEYYESMRRKK